MKSQNRGKFLERITTRLNSFGLSAQEIEEVVKLIKLSFRNGVKCGHKESRGKWNQRKG